MPGEQTVVEAHPGPGLDVGPAHAGLQLLARGRGGGRHHGQQRVQGAGECARPAVRLGTLRGGAQNGPSVQLLYLLRRHQEACVRDGLGVQGDGHVPAHPGGGVQHLPHAGAVQQRAEVLVCRPRLPPRTARTQLFQQRAQLPGRTPVGDVLRYQLQAETTCLDASLARILKRFFQPREAVYYSWSGQRI